MKSIHAHPGQGLAAKQPHAGPSRGPSQNCCIPRQLREGLAEPQQRWNLCSIESQVQTTVYQHFESKSYCEQLLTTMSGKEDVQKRKWASKATHLHRCICVAVFNTLQSCC